MLPGWCWGARRGRWVDEAATVDECGIDGDGLGGIGGQGEAAAGFAVVGRSFRPCPLIVDSVECDPRGE